MCYRRVVREIVSKEMTFELGQMNENIPGRKNRKCKGPDAGAQYQCSENNLESHLAGAL